MAGRQHISLELSDDLADKQDLVQIMSNSHINDHFHSLAREVRINCAYIFNYLECVFINNAFSWIYWNLKRQMKFTKLGWKDWF